MSASPRSLTRERLLAQDVRQDLCPRCHRHLYSLATDHVTDFRPNLMAPRCFRLGITGKISSGKSTFSALLREQGIEVLDTDSIAKEVMVSDSALRAELISILGPETYSGNELNRSYVASVIFSNEDARLSVEQAVHPVVMKRIEQIYSEHKAGEIVAVESALLIQTGYDELFDMLVLVDASDEAIVKRNEGSKHFSTDDLLARLHQQGFTKAVIDEADLTIENNSTLEVFRERSLKTIEIIRIMALADLPSEPLRSIVE